MSLEFRHIAYHYGRHRALSDINLIAPEGAITCLLGSSGCGKTTLLNLAAGLLAMQQGSIHLGGSLLCDASANPPPERRPVGLVFQDHALFPHLSITENIAFGLHKRPDRRSVTNAWLETIGLAGFGDRYPNSLSGGQQQRVALARAMAPEPMVLLMDEPFASVDIVLRRALRQESRRLLKERGATAIMVTHDPEEAMDIGDWIAVMEAGRIVQADSPQALYDRPATAAVGTLFGDAQVVPARRNAGGLTTPFGLWPLSCLRGEPPDDVGIDLLVRGAALNLAAAPDGLMVQEVRRIGARQRIALVNEKGDRLIIERSSGDNQDLPAGRVVVMPSDGSLLAFGRAQLADLPTTL